MSEKQQWVGGGIFQHSLLCWCQQHWVGCPIQHIIQLGEVEPQKKLRRAAAATQCGEIQHILERYNTIGRDTIQNVRQSSSQSVRHAAAMYTSRSQS
jgi:hypothetical protein